jgi:protein SCO1
MVNGMKKNLIVVSVLLALGIIAAVSLHNWSRAPLKLQAAQLLPAPKSMDGYGLTVNGNRLEFSIAKGRWILLFFGYTNCPDVCPLELQKLGDMLKKFDEAGRPKPLVAFISVDPERDSANMLQAYASHFHAEIVGVTAKNSELAALAKYLGADYNRTTTINKKEYLVEAGADMPPNAGEHYVVNHSSRIFIIDSQSRYVGSFAPPHDAAVLFSDMIQLMDQ